MGGGNSKDKSTSSANTQDEYWRMLKQRRQRAAEQHEKESHMRGKAYQELQKKQKKQQQLRQQKDSTPTNVLSQSSKNMATITSTQGALPQIHIGRMSAQPNFYNTLTEFGVPTTGQNTQKYQSFSKSPIRSSKNSEIGQDSSTAGLSVADQMIAEFGTPFVRNSNACKDSKEVSRSGSLINDRPFLNIERVQESEKSESNRRNTNNKEALSDPNLEWVTSLLEDLEATEDSIYKEPLKQRIDKMLSSFTVNMDPSNYRRLYRDKAFRENLNLPSAEGRQNSAASTPSNSSAQAMSQAHMSSQMSTTNSMISHYKVRSSGMMLPSSPAAAATTGLDQQQKGVHGAGPTGLINSKTQSKLQDVAAPATSAGLQEILTNPKVLHSKTIKSKKSHGGKTSDESIDFNAIEQYKHKMTMKHAPAQMIYQNNVRVQLNQQTTTESTQQAQPSTTLTPHAQPVLTNEEKTLRYYMEHDIVGLSIYSTTSHSKYSMKINTLRQHLTDMDDHPIVRLKDYFRDILELYIKRQTKAIEDNLAFYEMEKTSTGLSGQHKKLFEKVVKEVKGFVSLLHDAVVRFYILDIKVGLSYKQNEHLTNLLTSLVLKNPVYSDVHAIIRQWQRPQLKKVVQTINAIRSKYGRSLEETLKIDPVAVGQAIYRSKVESQRRANAATASQSTSGKMSKPSSSNDLLAQVHQAEKCDADEMAFESGTTENETPAFQPCDDRTAEAYFKKQVRKFGEVRDKSSPVLKLILIYRYVNELMSSLQGAVGSGPYEADFLVVVIFYVIVSLQTSEVNFLGARFIEECTYIESFIHEDQIDQIEEYTNIAHMNVVLETLQRSVRKCEQLFINPGSECSSGSRSSLSESATANALDEEEASQLELQQVMSLSSLKPSTMMSDSIGNSILKDSQLIDNSLGVGQGKSMLRVNPLESISFMASFDGKLSPMLLSSFGQETTPPPATNQAENSMKSSNQGLSVLQKLQNEGLFNFKNLPGKVSKPKQTSKVPIQSNYVPADVAYAQMNQLKSFAEQADSPTEHTTAKKRINSVASPTSVDYLASRTTKGSLTSSTNAGTLSSHKQSSVEAGSPLQSQIASKNDLSVIQEDVQIEEGCENELEGQRRTLQMLRQTQKNVGQQQQQHSQYLTLSELEEAAGADLHLEGLQDEQALFEHLENDSKGSSRGS